MARFFGGMLPLSSSKSEDGDDDNRADYSFAIEYKGPPISFDIPQAVPIDIHRIPTASVAATKAVMSKSFSLPIIQPIVRNHRSNQKAPTDMKSGFKVNSGKLGVSGRAYSVKLENGSQEGGNSVAIHNDQSSSSSDTLGFSDALDESNRLSESSDPEELGDECKAVLSTMSPSKESASSSRKLSSEISSCQVKSEDSATEASVQHNRTSAVTFLDGDEPSFPQRPVVSNHWKKGLCHRCHKRDRFAEKEVCIVCCAKYCSKCVIRAMGSMPEGRKCITCIGYRIDESKRRSLGKFSRMLKRLLSDEGTKQIRNSETSCEVNQLPPRLIWVNDRPLCKEELVQLQSCPIPPKKLSPGRYWYDKTSGFWGKEGKKPWQIISVDMDIGPHIKRDASNGDTKVTINSREITRAEHWMLRVAGICCEGSPNFWLTPDGSCNLEGMNNVVGQLWAKKRMKLACAVLSLPFPSRTLNPSGQDAEECRGNAIKMKVEQMNKLLLVGCDQSGTGTIFKQAKIIYDVPFSEDEKQSIKHVIQRNVYSYICILLEGRAHFEEEYRIEMRRKFVEEPGPSGIFEQVEQSNIYSLSPNLKSFSHWLQEIMISGTLDVVFPAATREYSPLVEQLWRDKAFQATYKRRTELHALPRVANYFLDRAVEISQADYEPSQMDILYADGITHSNGIASMEFSIPSSSSHQGYMESLDKNDPPIRYQLTRVHARGLGENCKWLYMFEDVDLVLYCVSLTDYDEYYEDVNGVCRNKMLAIKKHFETTVTHPAVSQKNFLLILNKFDLLEEKIDQVPLSQCDWFQDFNPVISHNPHNTNNNNSPPLAQRAFHYIAVKFKRLFSLLTGRKLFVTRATANEADSTDTALRYSSDILKWQNEIRTVSVNECSTASTEPSTIVENSNTE